MHEDGKFDFTETSPRQQSLYRQLKHVRNQTLAHSTEKNVLQNLMYNLGNSQVVYI